MRALNGIDRIRRIPQWTQRYSIKAILLFFLYLGAAQIAIEVFTAPALVSPATGIALAGLVIGGITLWPAIFFASFLSFILNGLPIILTLFLPPAYTLQAALGAYILKKIDFDRTLSRAKDMFALISVAFVTSTIVPTIAYGAAYIHTAFTGNSLPLLSWTAWWIGIALSLLTVAPFVIRWSIRERLIRPPWAMFEIILIFGLLVAANIGLWWIDLSGYLDLVFLYSNFALLAWIAFRFGSRSSTLGILLFTSISISGAMFGVRASDEPIGPQVFGVEMLIIPVAIVFYVLMSVSVERRNALTKLKDHVQQLQTALQQIKEEDRAKSNFISILAHELRNPLAPIVSSVELLKLQNPANGKNDEMYDVIESRAHMMRRLLDDLLDASRIREQRFQLQFEHADIRELIHSSIRTVKRQVEERKQTLRIQLPDYPLVVNCDPIRMEQIFTNILTNATKFTQEGGEISLTAATDTERVIIQISDNGKGIEPHILERIFERFLSTGYSKRGETGLGIGLSLTHSLVELQRGTITAESPGKNQGSTFTVIFPLVVSDPRTNKTTIINDPPIQTSMEDIHKILVVDDNIDAANGIERLLQVSGGHQTETAYSGTEAIQKVRSFNPEIVILDIGLPDMNGFEVARELRQVLNFSGILIALTGYGQEEDKQKAYDSGFDHHLTKPVSLKDLVAVFKRD